MGTTTDNLDFVCKTLAGALQVLEESHQAQTQVLEAGQTALKRVRKTRRSTERKAEADRENKQQWAAGVLAEVNSLSQQGKGLLNDVATSQSWGVDAALPPPASKPSEEGDPAEALADARRQAEGHFRGMEEIVREIARLQQDGTELAEKAWRHALYTWGVLFIPFVGFVAYYFMVSALVNASRALKLPLPDSQKNRAESARAIAGAFLFLNMLMLFAFIAALRGFS